MSTGIILPSLVSLVSSKSETFFLGARYAALKRFADINSRAPQIPSEPLKISQSQLGTISADFAWTPPQWNGPALTIISLVSLTQPVEGLTFQESYVFDAVFKIIHRRVLRKTSHPVLTGANISDHAYMEPVRVSLEIGMSDAMSSYSNEMWTNSATKSVSAWQKIKEWQITKQFITLTTRLDTYDRMMVVETEAPDDNISRHGLRATVILEELLSATTKSYIPVSKRPHASNDTQGGPVQATPPNPSATEQYVIPSDLYQDVSMYPQVPGAGRISGNNLGTQALIPA